MDNRLQKYKKSCNKRNIKESGEHPHSWNAPRFVMLSEVENYIASSIAIDSSSSSIVIFLEGFEPMRP